MDRYLWILWTCRFGRRAKDEDARILTIVRESKRRLNPIHLAVNLPWDLVVRARSAAQHFDIDLYPGENEIL